MHSRSICRVALLATSLLISANGVAGETAPPPSPNLALDVHAPDRLVDIGGRKLNLRCSDGSKGDIATRVMSQEQLNGGELKKLQSILFLKFFCTNRYAPPRRVVVEV